MGPGHRRRLVVERFLRDALPKLRAHFARAGKDPRRDPFARALIVDDNKDLVELLTWILEQSGFTVGTAYDGRSGLHKARLLRPDLIVLNGIMPELGGLDVLRALRADPQLGRAKVIFESGHPGFEREALSAGADAFFTTPFRFMDFAQTARRLVGVLA